MKKLLQKEYELMNEILNNPEKKSKCMNLEGFDGRVELKELFQIREMFHSNNIFKENIGGSSIEGNGINFEFIFNEKPFFMRIELDDYE